MDDFSGKANLQGKYEHTIPTQSNSKFQYNLNLTKVIPRENNIPNTNYMELKILM